MHEFEKVLAEVAAAAESINEDPTYAKYIDLDHDLARLVSAFRIHVHNDLEADVWDFICDYEANAREIRSINSEIREMTKPLREQLELAKAHRSTLIQKASQGLKITEWEANKLLKFASKANYSYITRIL